MRFARPPPVNHNAICMPHHHWIRHFLLLFEVLFDRHILIAVEADLDVCVGLDARAKLPWP